MEKIVEQNLLFDFYGELLTNHQKEIYGAHILNDMTPSEIANNYGVTRQAAFDMIRRCDRILGDYEERLHLVHKFLATKEKVKKIHHLSQKILLGDEDELKQNLQSIEKVSNQILEEY